MCALNHSSTESQQYRITAVPSNGERLVCHASGKSANSAKAGAMPLLPLLRCLKGA